MLKMLRLFLRCPVKEPLCHAPLDKRPAQRDVGDGKRRIGKFTEMGISGFGGGGRVSPKRKAHSSDKALCLDAPFLTLCYCFPLLFLLFLLDAGLYEN